MVEIKYSVSYPYKDMIFVTMDFFDGSTPLQVKDPLVKPIYDVLLRYDLRGDLGSPMSVTAGANLTSEGLKVDNLLKCFKELETNGYLNATELEMHLRHPCHSEGFEAPRCGI